MLVAGLLLLVPACGSGPDVASPAATGERSAPTLERVEWQLQEVVEDGVARDVRAHDARFRLDGQGRASWQACNHVGGEAVVQGDHLRVGETASTLIGCTGPAGELDGLLSGVLAAGATWRLQDGGLVLSSGGTVLRFAERGTPWESPEDPTLLEGAVGEQRWRLSSSDSGEHVGITLEVAAPGHGAGSGGFALAVDEPLGVDQPLGVLGDLGPMAVGVGDRALVAVPASREAVRLVAVRDGVETPLQAFDVGATTWQVWAALLPHPSLGTSVVAYDAAGTELARSRTLPY